MSTTRKATAGETAPAGQMFVKAKGGYYWHIKPTASNTSLCGHTPKDSPRSHMVRAGWYVLRDPAAGLWTYSTICLKCDGKKPT